MARFLKGNENRFLGMRTSMAIILSVLSPIENKRCAAKVTMLHDLLDWLMSECCRHWQDVQGVYFPVPAAVTCAIINPEWIPSIQKSPQFVLL